MTMTIVRNTQTAFDAMRDMGEADFMTCICMLFDMYAQRTGKDAVEMAALVATCVKNVNEEEGAY